MLKDKKITSQRGAVAIILGVLLLAVMLVVGTGVSILMLSQIKLSSQVGRSVVAFYGGEAGAEKCLYQIRRETRDGCDPGADPSGIVEKEISGTIGDPTDPTTYVAKFYGDFDNEIFKVGSLGQFRDTSRKVELNF